MPRIANFEKNGITINVRNAPAPMGPPSPNVIGWIVTAPDKHDDVKYHIPFRVASEADAAKLDTTGDERGTGYHAAIQTLKKAAVAQYFIVVPEEDTPAATKKNIIGKVEAATERNLGTFALNDIPERVTVIAAPGYSDDVAVIDALAVQAKRLRCKVVVDGPCTTSKAATDFSQKLGGEGKGHERVIVAEGMPFIYSAAASDEIYVPPSTVAVGALAAVKPWESPGNQGVYISGVNRSIKHSISDGSTEANLMNQHGLCCFVHNASQGGYMLMGNRTVTGRFIHEIGAEDAIANKIEDVSQVAMAKQLTQKFMEQEITKINNFIETLVKENVIPGGRAYLPPELNTVDRYRNGSWYIAVEFGHYAVNEHMIFHLNENTKIVEQFLEDL